MCATFIQPADKCLIHKFRLDTIGLSISEIFFFFFKGANDREKWGSRRGMGISWKGSGRIEMMGVVFSKHKLKVGSGGSCIAGEF